MYRAHFLDVLGVKRHELRVLGGRLHLLIIIISPISTSNSPIIISSPTHINVWNKYRFQFRIVYIKKKSFIVTVWARRHSMATPCARAMAIVNIYIIYNIFHIIYYLKH